MSWGAGGSVTTEDLPSAEYPRDDSVGHREWDREMALNPPPEVCQLSSDCTAGCRCPAPLLSGWLSCRVFPSREKRAVRREEPSQQGAPGARHPSHPLALAQVRQGARASCWAPGRAMRSEAWYPFFLSGHKALSQPERSCPT